MSRDRAGRRRGRRDLLCLVPVAGLLSMALTAPPASAAPTCGAGSWSGSFYAGAALAGAPLATSCDAYIGFDWGSQAPAPGVPADNFSARWSRAVPFVAGAYTFTLTGDDGVRLVVDGARVVDGWRDQGPTPYTVTLDLSAGSHDIAVEYYEHAYGASVSLSYAPAEAPPPGPTDPPAQDSGANLVPNGDLAQGAGMPTCFVDGSWGTATRTGAVGTDVPVGSHGRSYKITTTGYSSGDSKILVSDSPGCAPVVTAGTRYTVGLQYKSTATQNGLVLFTESAGGGWQYWTTITELPAVASWTAVTEPLPDLPAGTTRVSFGLAAVGAGTVATTGYSLRSGASQPPPAVTTPRWTGPAATGRWSQASVELPNRAIHSTLLRDGRVLLIAGSGNDGANFAAGTFTAATWDPKTGAMTTIPVPQDMFCSGHVTLSDGKVLIMGGTLGFEGVGSTTFTGLRSSYIFDPTSSKFSRINDANEGHWYPTLTKLGSGDVWAAGGLSDHNPSGGGGAFTTEMFDAATRRWLTTGEVPQTWTYWGEYPGMFLLADGDLLYTGSHTFGNQRAGSGSSVYDIGAATVGDIPGLPAKDSRDHAGSVLLPPAQNQKFLIAGGGWIDRGAAPTSSAAVVDMNAASPSWRPVAPVPGPGKQYLNLTNLFDRTVLAANGATGNRTGDVRTAAIFNPATETWTEVPADPVGRNYHSSSLLMPDGRVFVLGSNPADNTFEMRISIYEPPYLFRGDRPTVTGVPSTAAYGKSFALGVTGDVRSASLTSPNSATHQLDANSRVVDLPIAGQGDGRTAVVPSNRDLLPPGPYMLTVLSADGVPSVAKWVNIR